MPPGPGQDSLPVRRQHGTQIALHLVDVGNKGQQLWQAFAQAGIQPLEQRLLWGGGRVRDLGQQRQGGIQFGLALGRIQHPTGIVHDDGQHVPEFMGQVGVLSGT